MRNDRYGPISPVPPSDRKGGKQMDCVAVLKLQDMAEAVSCPCHSALRQRERLAENSVPGQGNLRHARMPVMSSVPDRVKLCMRSFRSRQRAFQKPAILWRRLGPGEDEAVGG